MFFAAVWTADSEITFSALWKDVENNASQALSVRRGATNMGRGKGEHLSAELELETL